MEPAQHQPHGCGVHLAGVDALCRLERAQLAGLPRFQPLAPRSPTIPGQATLSGWQRWVKSWCLDFVFNLRHCIGMCRADRLDTDKLPERASTRPPNYAGNRQSGRRLQLRTQKLTGDLDLRFGKLTDERIAAHPLRYSCGFPGPRAICWLRPARRKPEHDLGLGVYAHHNEETRFQLGIRRAERFLLLLALAGWCWRPAPLALMVAYILVAQLRYDDRGGTRGLR